MPSRLVITFAAMMSAVPIGAAAAPVRVVSMNLCADELVLRLADRDQVLAVAYLARETAVEDDDRAERRRGGDAEDARVRERVAQVALHRGAGQAETEADQGSEQRARNTKLPQDQGRQRRAAGDEVREGGGHVEGRVADGDGGER